MDEPPRGLVLPVALVLAFAAVLELAMQSLRAFFPLGYHLVGSLGFVVTPLVLVAVFLAPVLYPLLHRLLGRHVAPALAVALAAWRLVLQAEPVLATAVVAVVLALLALTALLPVAAGGRVGPDVVAAGTLVGFGLDIALRAWRATDDVVWSTGWEAWLDPSLLVPIVLLLLTVPALRAVPAPGSAPAWTWTVLLMPQLLLWTSLAFVGSGSGVPLAVTTAVLLGAVVAGMAVLASPRARVSWPVPALVLLTAALGMPRLTGWPVLVLAVLGVVATPLLLRAATSRGLGRPWSAGRHAATMTGAAVVMFVLLLLHPLHYEIPLPVSNAWLPAVAVVLACLPLLRQPGQAASYEYATPSAVHRVALPAGLAAAVALAGMVQLGMVGGSPAPGPDPRLAVAPAEPGVLRVATYNVGQGQDATTGRLAFRQVAEVVVGLDADVVALQEVPRGWPLTAMSDLDAWLRAQTDLTLAYVSAADPQYGNALAARVVLADVTALDLGQGGGAQRRSAIRAVLPDAGDVLMYGVHLQARNTEPAEQSRLDQMALLVDDWAGRPRTVVAGDLNPRNEYVDATQTPPKVITKLEVLLDAGLVTTQPTESCTAPTSNDNCSDYVFLSPDLTLVEPVQVLDTDVSDHRPVVATVQAPR